MNTLDGEMRGVLARLELVSNGTVQTWDAAGGPSTTTRPGQGHPEGRPAGCAGAEHLYWQARYSMQTTIEGRRDTIRDARRELQVLTGRYERRLPAGETIDETISRMLHGTVGWTPREVEQSRWRMSARLVRRHRLAAGRDPETGSPLSLACGDDTEPAARAREMKTRGMSVRQIALILGKDPRQIQRYLRQAI